MSAPCRALALGLALMSLGGLAVAQAQAQAPGSGADRPAADPWAGAPGAPDASQWQQCTRLADDKEARLACFDRWARRQQQTAAAVSPAGAAAPQPTDGSGQRDRAAVISAPSAPSAQSAPASAPSASAPAVATDSGEGCRDRQYSTLSRFWELEPGTDCGTLGLRGYRPLNVSLAVSPNPPPTPTSPSPGHDATPQPYQAEEMRIQLSVRTKLAEGLFTRSDPARRDSLWFGYTQQSAWQVFNGAISRPFRETDHEPELVYVYPTDYQLPGGWRWRYTGLGLVHQSNGQSLPLSRSWNRVYLMGGLELDDRFSLTGRIWKRLPESAANDDNPGISDYIGRAELSARWNVDNSNTLGITVRNNLQASGRGSVRLEWLKALGDPARSSLRLHTQLFYGYGDTLVDYNVKRTVLSIGLSLVDF